MFEEEDLATLRKVKKYSARQKKSFSTVINSKTLSEDELDKLFLSD
ncbi:MAG: hypothetical protein NDI94_02035 [Candidatus Woesearchaeota archaeon]|jgi:hypothetical protein|nr:hypothetical protein [Candidatus Woesearchaeota archaeon]